MLSIAFLMSFRTFLHPDYSGVEMTLFMVFLIICDLNLYFTQRVKLSYILLPHLAFAREENRIKTRKKVRSL